MYVRYVVTANVKLDESMTSIASLPPIFVCRVEHKLQCGISGTVSRVFLSLTHRASDVPTDGASCLFMFNVFGLNKGGAVHVRAVRSIDSFVFDFLRLILPDQVTGEVNSYSTRRNILFAAFRREQRVIGQ